MVILLFFAFISGLITILAPCIWPLLPIILSSSATGGKRKPLGITLGIMLSFGILTLTISYIVKFFSFDPDVLRIVAVVIIAFLGFLLVVPGLSGVMEGLVSRLSGKFGVVSAGRNGFFGGFLIGLSLGVVWTPCAGPILATIATLAATQSVNLAVVLVTLVYILGVGIPLFIFAEAGSRLFTKSRLLSKYTGRIQQVFGVVMIITALLILTGYDRVLQAKLLDIFPAYSSVLTKFESSDVVKKQLDSLKNTKNQIAGNVSSDNGLSDYGKAPNFVGIANWLNTDKPLTIQELKGKVVLVDFWTYTCINCIRTLPYITSWYDKYKDKGLVVVGVHTPEFEFEKKTENVENAIGQYGIYYPVAQDNDFATWNAYSNQYWPAKYLIDANGNIRYVHFGEGAYEETEDAIKTLLKEAGSTVDMPNTPVSSEKNMAQTPESYLGSKRIDRFASNEQITGSIQEFTANGSIPTHYMAYNGKWIVGEEEADPQPGSSLTLRFIADKVFLVITPIDTSAGIKVYLDGKLVSTQNSGKDVIDSVVKLDTPRLYELINLGGKGGEHTLKLEFPDGGVSLFAFTFG